MNKKFCISLKDNGLHSLNKSLEIFKEFEQNEDEFLLKESIMFLHHGIELLMKQVLIEKAGEYLIYSDINKETINKIIQAKKKKVSIFDLSKPPNTATYIEVINRIKAFVDEPELSECLATRLEQLNSIRNNIEHYAIDIDMKIIEDLIIKIRTPLIEFYEKGIEDFKLQEIEKVNGQWDNVSNIIVEHQNVEKIIEKWYQQKYKIKDTQNVTINKYSDYYCDFFIKLDNKENIAVQVKYVSFKNIWGFLRIIAYKILPKANKVISYGEVLEFHLVLVIKDYCDDDKQNIFNAINNFYKVNKINNQIKLIVGFLDKNNQFNEIHISED